MQLRVHPEDTQIHRLLPQKKGLRSGEISGSFFFISSYRPLPRGGGAYVNQLFLSNQRGTFLPL